MVKWRTGLRVVLAALIGAGFLAKPILSQTSVAEQYLFAAANEERAQHGLSQLHWDAHLYQAALLHCREMAARQSISHQYPGEAELSERGRGAGARFSLIAENVAEAPTSLRIHDAWMKSPGHRANILDPQVDSVGISVLVRNGQLYAVQDFGRTVQALTIDEQENKVAELIHAAASAEILPASDDWRRTCQMSTGYAGSSRPSFVMRFTSAELTRLPGQLRSQLASGKYQHVAIGACSMQDSQPFSTYSIAVLLFP